MTSLAHYRSSTSPADRRLIQTEAVITHRAAVRDLVSKAVLPTRFRTEAEQVGAIGVLVGLEKYNADRDGDFWSFARAHVVAEIERWIAHSTFWRPKGEAAPPVPLVQQATNFVRTSDAPRMTDVRMGLHVDTPARDAFVEAFGLSPELWTEVERDAVASVYFEGRSMRAAAAQRGVNFGTLRARVWRARRTLRRWLERRQKT